MTNDAQGFMCQEKKVEKDLSALRIVLMNQYKDSRNNKRSKKNNYSSQWQQQQRKNKQKQEKPENGKAKTTMKIFQATNKRYLKKIWTRLTLQKESESLSIATQNNAIKTN